MNVVPLTSNSLEQHWMPFTANRAFKAKPRIITGAKGMYYTTDRGETVLDGSAGLFCVAAGHGHDLPWPCLHWSKTMRGP